MRRAIHCRTVEASAGGVLHVLDSSHASVRFVKNGSGDAVAIHQSTRRSKEAPDNTYVLSAERKTIHMVRSGTEVYGGLRG